MIKKVVYYIRKPLEIITFIINKFKINVSDETYLKLLFKSRVGYNLDLEEPKTFNEKLQWLKLYDRKPEYIKMVDKYEVKKYVSEKIGEEYIIPTLGVWDKFEEINFDNLPNQFVLKCTHDSGGIIICKDKRELNMRKARKKLTKALKKNYYLWGREWPYKNIKPRIIAEKYMEDNNTNDLKDYKFMCFNGKVKCSFVCSNRQSGLNVDFYDLHWRKLPFERHYKKSNDNIPRPKNYDLMIKLSERLAENIPFVRIDWYEINNNLYFGEITFYPGSGIEEFNPEEWDKKIGDMLQLPDKMKV